MSADTALMPIPGPADPVTVPRAAAPRADGRVELVGLSRDAIRAALEEAGLEPRQAKLRAKQIWHWIYNRGVSDFSAMTDIAKAQAPWLAERFVITRPEVVEAQVSSDGTRKWLLEDPRRPRVRDGLHPRRRPRHLVRVEPGRLHAELHLLPHRHHAAGPQPRRRRRSSAR